MADATKDDHYTGSSLSAQPVIVLCTLSVSLYNAIELLLLIFVTFKRWGGLYFYSLLAASFGVLPYSIGYTMVYFQLTYSFIGLIINNTGWILMITGQSFVLYSRLHLVLSDQRILRAVLAMIIVDAIIFHIPTTVLNFCSNYYSHPMPAAEGYKVYEKVQMTGFCLQEFIISGLYMWKTVELLKVVSREDARRTMYQLFAINLVIVILDLGLLGVEYRNLRIYEQTFKGVVYSVKLKLEYAILGKLVNLVKQSERSRSDPMSGDGDGGILDFVDTTKSVGDLKHAPTRIQSHPSRKAEGASEHKEKRDSREKGSGLTSNGEKEVYHAKDAAPSIRSHTNTSTSIGGLDEDDSGVLYATAMRQITRE